MDALKTRIFGQIEVGAPMARDEDFKVSTTKILDKKTILQSTYQMEALQNQEFWLHSTPEQK